MREARGSVELPHDQAVLSWVEKPPVAAGGWEEAGGARMYPSIGVSDSFYARPVGLKPESWYLGGPRMSEPAASKLTALQYIDTLREI